MHWYVNTFQTHEFPVAFWVIVDLNTHIRHQRIRHALWLSFFESEKVLTPQHTQTHTHTHKRTYAQDVVPCGYFQCQTLRVTYLFGRCQSRISF